MRPLLTARWEDLLLLNWECSGDLLAPLVPSGTRLDACDGMTLISLVGFMFRDTRVLGLSIPFHRTFEEVNLRFYVVRETPDGERRRGVVFVRELVPRSAIAFFARAIYGEPYAAVPMSHELDLDLEDGGSAAYRWSHSGTAFEMTAAVRGSPGPSEAGSEAEFITEHYWGYTRTRGGSTAQYRVEHPRWVVWEVDTSSFVGAAGGLYGSDFAEILAGAPRSAFLAPGSEIAVYPGRRLAGT